VRIEAEPDVYTDATIGERLTHQVAAHLRDNIGIRMAVKLERPGTIERPTGKAIRVVDKREKK
jgi:phenylacetate-coenzyme A ligase PaaK-like adenylate-forming protein